jgi:hypothetical protein
MKVTPEIHLHAEESQGSAPANRRTKQASAPLDRDALACLLRFC